MNENLLKEIEILKNRVELEKENTATLEECIDRVIAFMYDCDGKLDYTQTEEAIEMLKGKGEEDEENK